jgi:hypothetical protein
MILAIMLNIVMLTVTFFIFMLRVIRLNVVLLSVVKPSKLERFESSLIFESKGGACQSEEPRNVSLYKEAPLTRKY